MRHGAKLTGFSDLDLAELLGDAKAVVDSYCNMPIGGSFLGGIVVGEQRPWKYPTAPVGEVGSRRVFPRLRPVQSVQGLRLVVGSEASASLPVDSLVIEQKRNFVEVTSASIVGSSGLFGVTGWVVPFGGLQQPIAEIDYTYGWSFDADDRLYPVGESVNILQAPNGHWIEDAEDPPMILIGGVELTRYVDPDADPLVANYVIDYEEGRVTLTDDPEGTVRAVYRHKLPREIVSASSLVAADLLGASKLVAKGMSGVRRLTAGEISIERESASRLGQSLDVTLPHAALMLAGFRYWSMA
jgi:hypothetical protein